MTTGIQTGVFDFLYLNNDGELARVDPNALTAGSALAGDVSALQSDVDAAEARLDGHDADLSGKQDSLATVAPLLWRTASSRWTLRTSGTLRLT